MDAFLRFPTTGPLDSLSWSPSGSLLVTTITTLYILTPKLSSLATSFHRTEIAVPKNPARGRYDFDDELDIRPDNTTPETFIGACWSPLKSSRLGGCLVLALTSRGRALVYGPETDPLTGTWSMIHDFTNDVHRNVIGKRNVETYDEFQDVDITSIAWSSPVLDKENGDVTDSVSFVSLGTKSGKLIVFRCRNQSFTYAGSFELLGKRIWLSRQSWSGSWDSEKTTVAVAGSDGSVVLIDFSLSAGEDGDQELVEIERHTACSADKRLPTAVRWNGQGAIAVAKGSYLFACFRDQAWETRKLVVPSFTPIVGLTWNFDGTELDVTLLDGVVYTVAASPTNLEITANRTSDLYSSLIRHRAFQHKAEDDDDDDKDQGDATEAAGTGAAPDESTAAAAAAVPGFAKDADKTTVLKAYPTQVRVYGACKSVFSGIDAIHLSLQSVADIEFKISVKNVSYLLFHSPVAERRKGVAPLLAQRLETPGILESYTSTPLAIDAVNAIIAETYAASNGGMQLDDATFPAVCLALAPPSAPSTQSPSVFPEPSLPYYEGPSQPSMAKHISALRTYWYQNVAVNKVKVLNAVFNSSKTMDPGSSVAMAANADLIHVHHVVGLVRSLEKLVAFADGSFLNPASLNTILTICDYVLLNPAVYGMVVAPLKAICELLAPALASRPQLSDYDLTPELTIAISMLSGKEHETGLPLRERCPACRDFISLSSPWTAECQHGHQWERCSVTMAVIDTPYARVCTGCKRRNLLPSYFGRGEDGKSLFAEVLKAYDQCIYCGEILSLTLKEV